MGVISLDSMIPDEVTSPVTLTVTVQDSPDGSTPPPASVQAVLTVALNCETDGTPVPTPVPRVDLTSCAPSDAQVAMLDADNPDGRDKKAGLTWSILESDSPFTVDPTTGKLTLARELTGRSTAGTKVMVTAQVEDSLARKPTTAPLKIEYTYLCDKAVSFSVKAMTRELRNCAKIGTPLDTVKAALASNDIVPQYAITPTDEYAIDIDTGAITTKVASPSGTTLTVTVTRKDDPVVSVHWEAHPIVNNLYR